MTLISTINRIAAATLGGYVFTWGCSAFGIAALASLGVAYDQAELAFMMLAILIYLAGFLWAFAAPKAWPVWCVLGVGGAALTAAAAAWQPYILVY